MNASDRPLENEKPESEIIRISISRREALRALLGAGVALTGASAFLAACGSSTSSGGAGGSSGSGGSKDARANASTDALACSSSNYLAFHDDGSEGHDHDIDLNHAGLVAAQGTGITNLKLLGVQTDGTDAGGSHTHHITSLTSGEIGQILAGTPVKKTAINNAGLGDTSDHTHVVQIFCIA